MVCACVSSSVVLVLQNDFSLVLVLDFKIILVSITG